MAGGRVCLHQRAVGSVGRCRDGHPRGGVFPFQQDGGGRGHHVPCGRALGPGESGPARGEAGECSGVCDAQRLLEGLVEHRLKAIGRARVLRGGCGRLAG